MSPVDLAGPPRRRVCRDRGTARRCGLGATRGAQMGGVRPRPLRGAASHEAEGRSGAAAPSSPRAARPPGVADSPVRVPATGATHGDVGDSVGRVRGYGRGGGMARRVPAVGVALGWGGSVLPRDPRRGILGGTLGGRCPATAAPRPVAAIRCREARASLRGGASHEAEGRRDARAGGADRVGPPTGCLGAQLRSRSIIALHPEIRGPA